MSRRSREQRGPFLLQARLGQDAPTDDYPFGLPAVRHLSKVKFGDVTVLVGDNGTGKSTVVEAIAVAGGFNAEGGSRNFRFATHQTHSVFARASRVALEHPPELGVVPASRDVLRIGYPHRQ
jgi:predicted ATPase